MNDGDDISNNLATVRRVKINRKNQMNGIINRSILSSRLLMVIFEPNIFDSISDNLLDSSSVIRLESISINLFDSISASESFISQIFVAVSIMSLISGSEILVFMVRADWRLLAKASLPL